MPFIYLKSPNAQQAISDRTRLSQKRLEKGLRCCDGDQTDLHVFHGAVTLDEYCYPALSESVLAHRNTDQALLRLTLGSMNRETIVLVDQIWAWQIQDVLVYTNLNTRMRDDFSWAEAYSGTYTEVAVLLADFIESNDVNQVFDMFQEAIVNLAEEVGEYLTKTGVESIGIDDEKAFYHKINDIREELSMLNRILSQQEEVWKDFASNAWPEIWADCQDGRIKSSSDGPVEDRRRLMRLTMRPWRRIQKSQRRISQLDEDAERVERSIAIQLDLKQKHASLKEAHATAVMSAAVFGFTVITIIFTPLSFVMSLFALPIDTLQASQIVSRWTGDAGMYSTHYIGTWAATTEIISIFLTLVAMWLALRYGLDYHIGPKLWIAVQSLFSLPAQTFAYLKRHHVRKSRMDRGTAVDMGSRTDSTKEAV